MPRVGSRDDSVLARAGIGTVVGHELTHGFDIKGAHFDESSQMEMWWTDQTGAEPGICSHKGGKGGGHHHDVEADGQQ